MMSTLAPPLRSNVAPWFKVIPVLFMINAGFGLAHHQLWFDEAQNWSVVRDSPTLAALFHNLGYEGHPGLWYLLLWTVQRFTLHPVAMKICHWLIAAGSIGLIGYLSPFRKLDRILLMAGYFLIFEYVVISRNYGIGMFLAFLYAYLETTHPQKKYFAYLTLGLLANCNAFTFLFSGVLVISRIFQNSRGKSLGQHLQNDVWALMTYAILAGLAAWTMYPPADMKYAGVGSSGQIAHDIGSSMSPTKMVVQLGTEPADHGIGALVSVLLRLSYIMPDVPGRFGVHPGVLHQAASLCVAIVAMGFTLAPFLILFSKKPLFAIYLSNFIVIFIFCFVLYQAPTYRHIGIFWISFVVCYWIKCHQDRRASNLASLFFAFGALWGVYATVQAYRSNYSNAQAAASWVREHGLQQAFWISYDDLAGVPLSAFLGIPTYSPDCRCTHRHVVWTNRRQGTAPEDVGADIQPVIAQLPGRIAYLISNNRWDQSLLRNGLGNVDIRYDVLQTYSGSSFDNYTLYRLTEQRR